MTEQERNDAMCQTQTSRMTLEFYRAAQGATLEGHASPLATACRTNRTLRCTDDRPQFLQGLVLTAAA
jgi:hypothetical protein